MSIKNNANPFKRSGLLVQAIQLISAQYNGLNSIMAQQALQNVLADKQYQSRGKGGRGRARAAIGFVRAQHIKGFKQTAVKVGHKKRDHNGAKEIARRLASNKKSVPVRKWIANDLYGWCIGENKSRSVLMQDVKRRGYSTNDFHMVLS